LYDLSITKEILLNEQYSKNTTVQTDTDMIFELKVRNNGDTAAENIVVTDIYDTPWLIPDAASVVYVSTPDGVNTANLVVNEVDNTIVISGFPKFMVGDEYIIHIPFTTLLEEDELTTRVENKAMVYVWDPKTDPLEEPHTNEFTNNEDQVYVLIAEPTSTDGDGGGRPIFNEAPEIEYLCANWVLEVEWLDKLLWTADDEQCDHGDMNDWETEVDWVICNASCKMLWLRIMNVMNKKHTRHFVLCIFLCMWFVNMYIILQHILLLFLILLVWFFSNHWDIFRDEVIQVWVFFLLQIYVFLQ